MVAAGLRLGLLAAVVAHSGSGALSRPDTASYLTPGRNLLLHGWFATNGVAEIDRTPGYGLFLALTSLGGPLTVAVVQIGLSILTVALVGRLARTIFGDGRAALVAAWLFAVEPLSIVYSILLLSETLFLTLLVASLERLAEFLHGRRLAVLAEAGLWLAAATMVRPVTYYLPWALAAGLVVALARVPGLRWKAPAVLLLSTMPWLAGWQIRNWVETGFGGFSSIQTQNLYFFNAAEVTGRLEGRSLAEVQNRFGYNDEQLFVMRHPEAAGWSQAQRLHWMQTEGGRVLRAHPGLFLRLHLAGVLRTTLNPGAAVFVSLFEAHADEETYLRERERGALQGMLWVVRTHPWQMTLMVVLEAWLLALYLLAMRGMMRADAALRVGQWLLVGVGFYFLAVSGGAVGAARLRLPVMLAVCILSASGVARQRVV